MSLPKVLFIEGDGELRHRLTSMFRHQAEFILAATAMEGEKLFAANPDLDAILIDASGEEPDAMPLVRVIREAGFQGTMIAIASLPQPLLEAGCNMAIPKWALNRELPAVLNALRAT